ncbi:PleD family two-component system response regulator [candidate division KSB1 bacterium]
MSYSPTKVLIIDDHRETRELVANIIVQHNLDVLCAPGGREGIQVAKFKNPDVILLDMQMPHFDGITTCKALKRIPAIKDIPVIFLTANTEPEIIKQAIASGGIDYIAKPFNPEDLMARIFKVTRKSGFDPGSVVKGV